jgi:hypothetical protein
MRGKDREQWLMNASRLGLNDYQARKLARLASTHNRLAEAECNGDYPCDNGERKVIWCDRCGSGYVRSATFASGNEPLTGHDGPYSGRICKSCRTEDLIRHFAALYQIGVEFQGDPRGWTVTLFALPVAATS